MSQSATDRSRLSNGRTETAEPEGEVYPAEVGHESSGVNLRRVAVSLVVVLAIVATVYFFDNSRQDQVSGATAIDVAFSSGTAPRIGNQAPDFELTGLDGKRVRLSDYRGQAVWINFWASWCPPCRAELPEVEAAYRERKDQGLTLLAVSVGEDGETVRRFADTYGMTSTVLLDSTSSVAALYRVNGLPTHLFVDKDGVVRDLVVGGLSRATILRRLDGVMR